ncbi:MAG: murein biosynthesis integral membrane protein MurJ [Patescibacteria group bacterium]
MRTSSLGFMRAGMLLAFFSFFAKATGLLRDRILASSFGAGDTLDIYYAAFRFPDLLFNLIVLGGIASAFIPIFVSYFEKQEEKAWKLARVFGTWAVTLTILGAVALGLGADTVARFVGPGFDTFGQERLALAITFMAWSPVLFAIGTIAGAVLQARERFFAYAVAPVLYNGGIIIGALYLAPHEMRSGGDPVLGLVYGVLLGASLHALTQWVAARRAGFRWLPSWAVRGTGVLSVVRLMIPRTLALGAQQIGTTITTMAASLLPAGGVTVLALASNVHFVPVSLIAIAGATAAFPQLSRTAARSAWPEFRMLITQASLRISGLLLLAAGAGVYFAEPIARIAFGAGTATGPDLVLLSTAISVFMIGVVPQGLIHVVARGFYALQDTRTPLVAALCGIITTGGIIAGAYTQGAFSLVALAGATVAGSVVQALVLTIILQMRLSRIADERSLMVG